MDPGAHGEVLGVVDEHWYPRLKGIPCLLEDGIAAGCGPEPVELGIGMLVLLIDVRQSPLQPVIQLGSSGTHKARSVVHAHQQLIEFVSKLLAFLPTPLDVGLETHGVLADVLPLRVPADPGQIPGAAVVEVPRQYESLGIGEDLVVNVVKCRDVV